MLYLVEVSVEVKIFIINNSSKSASIENLILDTICRYICSQTKKFIIYNNNNS